ncbi:MAG: hypothetical protein AAFO63_13740, partial [Pseudomonadota bacterium]
MTLAEISYYGLLLALIAWAIGLAWRWYTLPDFAGQVYDSNVEKNLLNGNIDRDAYIESYVRTEGPRFASYRCATAFAALLALPSLVGVFNWGWDFGWRLMGSIEGPFERGFMLHTFMTFIFVMAVIVAALYLVTAWYYRTAPPTLAEEIKRLEG